MQQNLFDGDRYQAQFAVITYRRLMSRQWVIYADIMAEFMGLDSAEQLPYGVSKCEHIGGHSQRYVVRWKKKKEKAV